MSARGIPQLKRPHMTVAQLEALSIEALNAHIYFERQRVNREQSDTAARQRALVRAERVLKAKKRGSA